MDREKVFQALGRNLTKASLARLRLDQGRSTEAGDLLAPVYGWFTEGFEIPDFSVRILIV